jgi:GT2 family glycosyltransferase
MDVATGSGDPRARRGARSPEHPSISIIVLVTTATTRLRACLASIDAHRPTDTAVEVLVVANGTPAEELVWLAARDDIVLLTSTVNLGFGGGCNWAATVARGGQLLFLNDDARACPGWLEALTRRAAQDSTVGVVGSRVLLANGMLQEVGGVVWSDGTTSGVGRGMEPGAPAFAAARDVDFVSFCSTLVVRAAWDDLGGFDEGFFPAYYEDTDLCLRAQRLGWRVVCEPASSVVHDEGSSSRPRFQRFLKTRNRRLFVERWSGFLATCEKPPSLAIGQRAVERALQRTAARARQPGARVAQSVAAPPLRVVPDEAGALRRLLALDEEYIEMLDRELDRVGLTMLARDRYRWTRAHVGRVLTRHPRLSNTVRRVVVSVGNRD